MAQVTIQFVGICTHMNRNQAGVFDSLAWGHRVVLVNASQPSTISDNFFLNPATLGGIQIEPHHAELQLLKDQIVSMTDTETNGFFVVPQNIVLPPPPPPPMAPAVVWSLDSVILSVANYDPGAVAPLPSEILSLAALCNDTLGPPSTAMTLNTIPTRAACFFDFFSALEILPVMTGTAVGMSIRVETLGFPVIRVRSFLPGAVPISITLEDEAVVTLTNLPNDPLTESNADFLLHFLTAEQFPPQATYPSGVTSVPNVLTVNPPWRDPPMLYITPGCSNSTFP
jgi:hypothetical protein